MPETSNVDTAKLLNALVSMRRGDFSVRLPSEWTGANGKIGDTFNEIAEMLQKMSGQFERVARVVGQEGKVGQRATPGDAPGAWANMYESVNSVINDLVWLTREIGRVIGAVAKGDLLEGMSVEIEGQPVAGEFLSAANTVNTMMSQLSSFASEVTRVAVEVGTEGKLGGQADVKGLSGTWKGLADSVNRMASNITNRVRNVAEVTTAVAIGDLSKKITGDVRGEFLQQKETINTMVEQLKGFASEFTRVALEVDTKGKLGGQADVKGLSGTWKDLTDSVNSMTANLTNQIRNITEVTIAIAAGDLSKKIIVDAKGEILELKNTINSMNDTLATFGDQVTKVAREVGVDGKLGGQAIVPGAAGLWKDVTDNVNLMAANLTNQVRNIATVTTAVATGDLSRKITVDAKGEILEMKNTINSMNDTLATFGDQVTKVAREVGVDGKLGGQAIVPGAAGLWKDVTDNVNLMAANLTNQVRNIATVTTAVATGDLSRKITVDAKGEILELKNTINSMNDTLATFGDQVTKVAREVGVDGKLGGQAIVPGAAGLWKDVTDNVNLMAANLTNQVRNIATVTTAVATGDLSRKITVDAKGEILEMKNTINSMIDTLVTFGDQVTKVAREVGVDGKLGGQAIVPGTAGIWKDVTDNVNLLAANLTSHIRSIAEVATAVTKGDLTRSVVVEAKGEVSELKDNVNEMIRNLRETTTAKAEQDWLKTNLNKFTRTLQGQRDVKSVAQLLLSELAPLVSAQHGVFYNMETMDSMPVLKLASTYGYKERKNLAKQWLIGEGLVGQCAYEKQRILLSQVPADYIQITSGLGEATPLNIVVLPVIFEAEVKAVIELASFQRFSDIHLSFVEQLTDSLGIILNNIEATMRTEDLLTKSQSLAGELQSQQEELQQTNEELEDKAKLLADQNREVERKNQEVEDARKSLEEKAEQLALTSKYKI